MLTFKNMAECEANKNLFEDFSRRCRTCLALSAENNVFSKKVEIGNDNLSLAELLVKCASVQISEQDGLPQQICQICEDGVIKSHMFRIQCEASNAYLQKSLIQKIQISKNSAILIQEIISEYDDIGAEETITLTVENDENQSLQINHINSSKTSCSDEFEENDDYHSLSDSSVNQNCTNQIIAEEFFEKHAISSSKTSPKKETLVKHIPPQTYKCHFCDTTFHNFTEYATHQNQHKTPTRAEDSKKRTCPFCDKVFQYRTSMLKHQKKHNAPPKTCPYCNFQPSTPSNLSKHMEQAHSHLKTFICSLCDKAFFKKANLRQHVQMHSGVKKHTCEICGLSFVLRGNLSVHRRLHTGERPYTCSVCGRGFTQQSALRSHEAGHSDRRDHVCQECGAAFSRAGALRNHQKRHSSAKPFECSICGKRFTFSSERKRHVLIHSGDKNHECEVCGSRFTRNTNLKVHRRIHTGETPHVCKVCGKGFVQAHCLRTHMNTHVT